MPPVKSWCCSLSFFSFALREEVVHAVVLMFLLLCGVYFLLADRFFFLKFMGILQEIRLSIKKDLACLVFYDNASFHGLTFDLNCSTTRKACVSPSGCLNSLLYERRWLLLVSS